jgi:hypothetical protein
MDKPVPASEVEPREAPDTTEFRNRVVGLEMVPARRLREHPKNWRQHPDDQQAAMKGVLESVGVADAVLAYHSERNDGELTLIDGHLRRGMIDQEIPVLVTDLNDAEADAMLASHDVLTTMAVPDEYALRELLEDVEDTLPRDVLMVIDPDFADRYEEEEVNGDGPPPKYPIVPTLDEGYHFVVIFAMRDVDYAWLQTTLDLPRKLDRKRVGISHVLTVDEFRERWNGR